MSAEVNSVCLLIVSLPQIHVTGDFSVQESQTIRVSTNSARTASELSVLLREVCTLSQVPS